MEFLQFLFAFVFPPLGVCLNQGCCSCDLLFNIVLTLLGWIPGVIHAFYVIDRSRRPQYVMIA
ncbi:hypothetical protein BDK51DRAFT_18756 [Blyttiomyces helicus]|uniref:Plasma membrane proteolipid 3 n=1 Tax=Blyttiomyces helicus TaxID=388810 RepID=A0A4P9W9V6_9FUNG|nr:hypothetical protein BDK51DRAFT_18756 [Blyttiomyces helicus]|eukprot:RKO88305.1 hypothetical protein BDK51DRAFT_18756 [Blyttiomyces helicus]